MKKTATALLALVLLMTAAPAFASDGGDDGYSHRRGEGPDVVTITLDPPVVSIDRNGSNIVLTWPTVINATSYEVWRANNDPYFAIGSDCAASPGACALTYTNSYVHYGGSGSAEENFTYLVRAVRGAVRSAPSNRAAEFDFALVPGVG